MDCVDAYLWWPEVIEMKSSYHIHCYHPRIHGLPLQVVSDDGSSLNSSCLWKSNQINIRCAPFHPSSNGTSESPSSEKSNQSFQQRMSTLLCSAICFWTDTFSQYLIYFVQVCCQASGSEVTTCQVQRTIPGAVRVLVWNIRPGQAWLLGTVAERNVPAIVFSTCVYGSGTSTIREMNGSPQQWRWGPMINMDYSCRTSKHTATQNNRSIPDSTKWERYWNQGCQRLHSTLPPSMSKKYPLRDLTVSSDVYIGEGGVWLIL